MAAIAFADPADFVELHEEEAPGENPIPGTIPKSRAGTVRSIRLDRGDTRVISAIHIFETKEGEQRINLKLHNKLDALKMLGRDAGMFEEEGKVPPNMHWHIHL